MYRWHDHTSSSRKQPLALLLGALLTIAACSSDPEGVQLPDGSDAIIVDEVTALSANLSGEWGTGRALVALPVDNRTAVVTTTGVYIVDGDGEAINLDVFGQTTDIGDVAVSDDGSTLAVATLWPSAVRWYDLEGDRFLGITELTPSPAIAGFGFLGGTGNLVAVTSTGVTMWPVGPAGGAASPLADALPGGQPAFFDDRLAVPVAGTDEIAIISADAVNRVPIDLPQGAEILGTRSSPDGTTLAVAHSTLDSGDGIIVFDTNSFERSATFSTGGAVREGSWAVSDGAVAITDGDTVTMWSHGGESLGARQTTSDQVIQTLLPNSDGVVSVHAAGAVVHHPDDSSSPARDVTDGGIALQHAVVDDDIDGLLTVDFYGLISSIDIAGIDPQIDDDRFAAGESTGVAISSDAGSVAIAATNGTVTLLDADLNEQSAFAVRGTPVRIDDVEFNPVSGLLSTGLAERVGALAFDDTVTTWNPGDGSGVYSVGGEAEDVPDCGFFYNRVTFTEDGSLMASTSHDFTVALIDAATGAVEHRFEPLTSTVLGVAFTPDDDLLVATGDAGTVTVYDVADRSIAAQYEAPLGGYRALAMLPNAPVMATADVSGTLRLIEVLTGRTMLTFDDSAAPTTSIALSPDGAMLAAPDDDSAVSIWSTDSGLLLTTITGHTDVINDLTFSADSAWLLTSSTDGTARRWNLETTT